MKAAVFPEPVGAAARTSRPWKNEYPCPPYMKHSSDGLHLNGSGRGVTQRSNVVQQVLPQFVLLSQIIERLQRVRYFIACYVNVMFAPKLMHLQTCKKSNDGMFNDGSTIDFGEPKHCFGSPKSIVDPSNNALLSKSTLFVGAPWSNTYFLNMDLIFFRFFFDKWLFATLLCIRGVEERYTIY